MAPYMARPSFLETVEDAAPVALTNLKAKAHSEPNKYAWKIVWRNVIFFAYLHAASAYGFYLALTGQLALYSYLWSGFLVMFGIIGITGGSHRLWSHRTYKAKWPLRVLLMVMQTVAFQNHIYEWARDHRVHHKFMDTDADPHNINRGFFFAHMGWLLVRKHPDVQAKGAGIDLSDLERDSVVMFQKKYYFILMPLLAFVLPAAIPVMLWGEGASAAWHMCSMARYATALHVTWCINSVAHVHGMQPIDKSISPRNNSLLGHMALGEGWHNYHHVFPWDYKTAELGSVNGNITAAFIDLFARVGWAYDRKTVPQEMIDRRMRRSGDGSHPRANGEKAQDSQQDNTLDHCEDTVWGWGDKDMPREDVLGAARVPVASG